MPFLEGIFIPAPIIITANRYKREGLRLWLYRCSWGLGADPKWLGKEGHPEQMKALLETLQRPTVLGKAITFGVRDIQWQGFWLQIQVPSVLAGKEVALEPMMAHNKHFYSEWLQTQRSSFYEQFLKGNWVDPLLLGQLPDAPPHEPRQPDFPYTGIEQHRLWQVWISTPLPAPVLELQVKYPYGFFQADDERAYVFRIAMTRFTNEADRLDNIFSGELKPEDDSVLAEVCTEPLMLPVPGRLKHEY